MVRVVFGLLSVHHPQYSSKPELLYTVVVLPEMLALYITAFPGLVPKIGWDCEHHLGIAPAENAESASGYVPQSDADDGDDPYQIGTGAKPAAVDQWRNAEHQQKNQQGAEVGKSDTDRSKGLDPGEMTASQQQQFIGVHRGQSGMDDDNFAETPTAWRATVPLTEQQSA